MTFSNSDFTKTRVVISPFPVVLILLLALSTMVNAQFADPALGGADFSPDPLDITTVGATSMLTASVSNSGSTPIPSNSVEIVFSFPDDWYETDGLSEPTGAGAAFFNTWIFVTTGGEHQWRGSNNNVMAPFDGGEIVFMVSGLLRTEAPEVTSINIQPVANFAAFQNAPANDNLQPDLEIEGLASLPDPDPCDLPGPYPDSDGDGLDDCYEGDIGTDPDNPDTDGGGVDDGDEIMIGGDPLDSIDDPTLIEIIPTMGQWGLISLGLLMMIIGVTAIRQSITIQAGAEAAGVRTYGRTVQT